MGGRRGVSGNCEGGTGSSDAIGDWTAGTKAVTWGRVGKQPAPRHAARLHPCEAPGGIFDGALPGVGMGMPSHAECDMAAGTPEAMAII